MLRRVMLGLERDTANGCTIGGRCGAEHKSTFSSWHSGHTYGFILAFSAMHRTCWMRRHTEQGMPGRVPMMQMQRISFLKRLSISWMGDGGSIMLVGGCTGW